jgi:hypothetical protein
MAPSLSPRDAAIHFEGVFESIVGDVLILRLADPNEALSDGFRKLGTRRLTLAKAGTITPDEARTLAKKTLGSVAHGADPAAQRAADKLASTLAEVAEQFLTEHVEAKRAASSAAS